MQCHHAAISHVLHRQQCRACWLIASSTRRLLIVPLCGQLLDWQVTEPVHDVVLASSPGQAAELEDVGGLALGDVAGGQKHRIPPALRRRLARERVVAEHLMRDRLVVVLRNRHGN
jgi:hypothetical protein